MSKLWRSIGTRIAGHASYVLPGLEALQLVASCAVKYTRGKGVGGPARAPNTPTGGAGCGQRDKAMQSLEKPHLYRLTVAPRSRYFVDAAPTHSEAASGRERPGAALTLRGKK